MTAIVQEEKTLRDRGVRRGPVTTVRQSATVAWRQLVQIKHSPEQLVEVGIQPLIFIFAFAFVLAGQMSGSRHEYLQFVVPGLITQAAVLVTARTAIGLNTDVTTGIFDRLRSLPIARSAPLIGRIAADFVMLLWSVFLLVAVGILLSFRIETSWMQLISVLAVLLIFSFALSWAAILAGLHASSPENTQAIVFGTMLPMMFLSNAFVETDTLPGWLQAVVKVNPASLLSDTIRGLLVEGPVATPLLHTLIACAVMTVVFAPLALRAYHRER